MKTHSGINVLKFNKAIDKGKLLNLACLIADSEPCNSMQTKEVLFIADSLLAQSFDSEEQLEEQLSNLLKTYDEALLGTFFIDQIKSLVKQISYYF